MWRLAQFYDPDPSPTSCCSLVMTRRRLRERSMHKPPPSARPKLGGQDRRESRRPFKLLHRPITRRKRTSLSDYYPKRLFVVNYCVAYSLCPPLIGRPALCCPDTGFSKRLKSWDSNNGRVSRYLKNSHQHKSPVLVCP